MSDYIQEAYGRLMISSIISQVWLGDWEGYEKSFQQLPEEIKKEFPFHIHYNRDDVSLWYDNHFAIPGDYFIPPYLSSYSNKQGENPEEAKQDLLCLIGIYEKVGFYYPLEKEVYPDHIGCLAAFQSAAIKEEIKALQNEDLAYVDELRNLQQDIQEKYFSKVLKHIQSNLDSFEHEFFKQFIPYNWSLINQSLLIL